MSRGAILRSIDHLEAPIKVGNAYNSANNRCNGKYQRHEGKEEHHVFPKGLDPTENDDAAN